MVDVHEEAWMDVTLRAIAAHCPEKYTGSEAERFSEDEGPIVTNEEGTKDKVSETEAHQSAYSGRVLSP